MPQNPTDIVEVHNVLVAVKTKQNKTILLMNNEKENIILLCETNHRFLQSLIIIGIYMNGTFDYYTRFFI
jgi:hypothetical protein